MLFRSASPNDKQGVIGVIGTLEMQKGQSFALQVLSVLNRGRAKKVILRFIGSDPFNFGSQLKDEANLLGVAKNVEFCGILTSRKAIYTGLDLVLIPSSVRESFCLVAIEALAEGVPVIASSAGALPEVLEG